MAGVSLSGMASGLDTASIIDQLMAIEGQSKARFLTKQKYAEGRKSAFDDVARQLRALNTAVTDLKSVLTWGDTQKVTGTDDKVATARLIGSAPAGNITVNVTQLARVEQRAFDFADVQKSLNIGTVKDGVTTNVAVDLSTAVDAADAVKKINETAGIGVYAGVVNGQIVLTGKKLGEGIAVTDSLGAAVADDAARRVLAQKTAYTINGVAQDETVESVVKPGGLPGVELTLKSAGTTTLSITPPGVDTEKVKTKLKTFVENYNATLELINNKVNESKVKNPSVTSDFVKGALRGDAALMGMVSRLREAIQPLDGTPSTIDTLAEIGISVARADKDGNTSADAKLGKLVIDDAKLTNVLASNPADVKKLLQGIDDTTGVANTLSAVLEPISKATTGYLARSASAADSEATRMKDRQADMDKRLALKEERLRRQFTALETALGSSQSQIAWIQGQVAGLPTWG